MKFVGTFFITLQDHFVHGKNMGTKYDFSTELI